MIRVFKPHEICHAVIKSSIIFHEICHKPRTCTVRYVERSVMFFVYPFPGCCPRNVCIQQAFLCVLSSVRSYTVHHTACEMKSAVMAVACASGASAFVAPSLVTNARVAAPAKTTMMCKFFYVTLHYNRLVVVVLSEQSAAVCCLHARSPSLDLLNSAVHDCMV